MSRTKSRKAKEIARIENLLKDYRILDKVIYLDEHKRGFWEEVVQTALIDLEKSSPSLDTLYVIYRLLDGVLSQALNRDPSLPYGVGIQQVNGNVGQVK